MKNDSFSNKSFSATIDGVSDEFEARWRSGAVPSIEDYLGRIPKDQAELRKALLMELVAVDIEYRWSRPDVAHAEDANHHQSRAVGPVLDGYVARFPECPPVADLPLDLVVQEYRVRHEWGDKPGHDEYRQRFPRGEEALSRALAEIDHAVPTRQADKPLKLYCPLCQTQIILVANASIHDVRCPSCGSKFNLANEEATATFRGSPGVKIGRFELSELLGQGAFGTVWKAFDPNLERTVAVKIPRHRLINEQEVKQFWEEAKAAARLSHSNIVAVHEVGQDGDTTFIVTEFVEGATLAEWMESKRVTPPEAIRLCVTIAEALHAAHEQGVVHRDVKPGNIMLDREGRPRVMDFGLAKRDIGEIVMTRDGRVLGTPAYMSPEQARGDAHLADRRSDVYSLGVVLYQLLTGELPFRGSWRMLKLQILNDDPPSPRKLNGAIRRDLETICLTCLKKDPQRRYQTAAEFAADLGRYSRGEHIARRPASLIERGWSWCRRNPAVSALSAVVFSLLITLSGALYSMYIQKVKENEFLRTQKFSVVGPGAGEAGLILKFGLYESYEWRDLKERFEPFLQQLANDLTARLGKRVQIDATIYSDDYQAAIQRMAGGEFDFTRCGPAPYVAARDINPNIRLLAMDLEDNSLEHRHDSYIFVRNDSGIDDIAQLGDKRIAFADPHSTTGTVFFKSQLAEAGITRKNVAETHHFDKHPDVAKAVAREGFHAGCTRYTNWLKADKNYPGELKRIRKFPVPNKPWVARSDLDDDIAKAIQDCLIDFKNTDALAAMEVDRFDIASPEEYDEVERVLDKSSEFDGIQPSGRHLLPARVEHEGTYDASGAVALNEKYIVVGNDEDNVLRAYDGHRPGKPLAEFDLSRDLDVGTAPTKPKEVDIEGATQLKDRVYWISSHGTGKIGDERLERRRFFATRFNVEDEKVRMEFVGKPCKTLLDEMLASPQLAKYNFAAAAKVAPKAGGLNIEGLAATPDEKILIGFRSPLTANRRAIIVPLLNPDAVIEGKAARFGDPIELDLGGLGVRGLDYFTARNEFVVLAGPVASGACRIYRWSGPADHSPREVASAKLDGWAPESCVIYPGKDADRIQIISDDGENKSDTDPKRFRSGWLKF